MAYDTCRSRAVPVVCLNGPTIALLHEVGAPVVALLRTSAAQQSTLQYRKYSVCVCTVTAVRVDYQHYRYSYIYQYLVVLYVIWGAMLHSSKAFTLFSSTQTYTGIPDTGT